MCTCLSFPEDGCEDENGNPVDSDRELLSTGGIELRELSSFPRRIPHFAEYLPGVRDQGDDNMSPALDSQQTKKQRRRKRKDETIVKADSIPGHIGNKSLDELLSFIDGANGNVPGHAGQKQQQNAASVVNNNNRTDRDRTPTVMMSDVNNSTFPGHLDNVHNNLQARIDIKSKKKKKGKSSSKASSEVDDQSSRTSEVDLDKIKDAFSESSLSSDLLSSITTISSSKASSVVDDDIARNHVESLLNAGAEAYIFTDFQPMIQKEEQFTVVSKLKKKKRPVPMGRDFSYSEYRNEDVPSRRRSRPPPRSFTPPPTTSETKSEGSSDRALSPSAFPELGKIREARRNSTGNLAELERSYDSDMESVKSVPPTGSASDTGKSSQDISTAGGKPPISYASIAAGGHGSIQECDQITLGNEPITLSTPSQISGLNGETLSTEEEYVTLVANGSTDLKGESVHSCGSSSRPSSASSSINCAKPELSQPQDTDRTVTVSIKDSDLDSAVAVAQSDVDVVTGFTEVSSCLKVVVQSTQSQSVGTEPQNKEDMLNVNNTVDFPALSPSVPAALNTSTKSSSTSQSASTCRDSVSPVIVSSQADSVSSIISPASMTSTSSSTKPSVTCSNGPKGLVNKPPTVFSTRNSAFKSKSKLSKSVIFMDRRMNERPSNLGISFGFEPDLDNNVMINSARLDSSSTCSSDSGRGTDSDCIVHTVMDRGNNNNRSSTVVDNGTTNSLDNRTCSAPDVIMMESHHAGDNNNTSSFSLTSTKLLNSQCQNQLVFIGPEHAEFTNPVTFTPEELHKFKVVAPPNGIVAPQPAYILPAPPNKDFTMANNHINAIHQCPNKPETSSDPSETILQSIQETNKDEPPQKVFTYDRAKDPNFQPGNFNHEAGVAFLHAGQCRN